MTKSSLSDKSKPAFEDSDKLEFPVCPDFDSTPPKMTPTEYYRWCKKMKGTIRKDPAEEQAKRNMPEFVLKD